MKRHPTIDEKRIVESEYDMLEGNIKRMCVTDDLVELEKMYKYAQKRLDHIYSVNRKLFC